VTPLPERILLVLAAGIGDFAMATPAIRALRRGFPAARLALLTTPQAEGLARPCPHLDEVFTFDLRAYRPAGRGPGWRGWRPFWDLTADLRARRFDLAVNLFQVATLGGALRMGLLVVRLRAARTAGRWSGGLGAFFGIRGPDRRHGVDAMLALASALGCPADSGVPQLWVPEASRRSAAVRLRDGGLGPGEPFAVLHPGSNKPEACLPLPKAVEIGQGIRRGGRLRVLLTGDTHEVPLAQAVCDGIGAGALCLAGRTDLLELAAILEAAQVAVTTDSGPMHMAAALGAPLVALFGPGDPARFAPRGRQGQVVILQGRARPRDPLAWHADLASREAVDAALRLLAAAPVGAKV
jgi:ADP-heptose:LPS heptosyltransferase